MRFTAYTLVKTAFTSTVVDCLYGTLPKEMARSRQGPSNTIVIKLGTSSIVHETTHQPLLSTLSAVVETVVHLRAQGHKVVLVSSGAIGVGLKRMDMAHRPKNLSGKQALAAIGQGRLIALWDNLFSQLEQPIAQVLLTRGDISDRTRYLNAVNTFKELISMGVIPIVNENDTVSVSEIKFGDNDTLSAITASMIHADYLFLLTDVDALYTANPRKDPTARSIDVVSSISTIRSQAQPLLAPALAPVVWRQNLSRQRLPQRQVSRLSLPPVKIPRISSRS